MRQEELTHKIKMRRRINQEIRSFFSLRDYLEVETPLIVRSPGMEPNLMPFETQVIESDGTKHQAGLITSPEYAMKKLMGEGLEKIFTLTRVFRNGEELGGTHEPEFTMLEWYRQGADYRACMDETEALVRQVHAAFGKSLPPFARRRVRDLVLEEAGVDLGQGGARELRASCERFGIRTDSSDTESDLFYRLFLARVEPNLGSAPVFVYDYPKYQASLSRLTPDGRFGERFELYVNGLELCNGFTELTDAQEQRSRFEEEAEERRTLGKTVFPVDEEFLHLLPSLRQPSFGNALGVDRLLMLAMGAGSIDETLLFPAARLFHV